MKFEKPREDQINCSAVPELDEIIIVFEVLNNPLRTNGSPVTHEN